MVEQHDHILAKKHMITWSGNAHLQTPRSFLSEWFCNTPNIGHALLTGRGAFVCDVMTRRDCQQFQGLSHDMGNKNEWLYSFDK